MIAIELTGAVDAAGTLTTFYLSTDKLVTSPTDTPINTAFQDRIMDPGTIGIHAFADGRTGGSTKLETGQIVIANADAALDAFLNYSFDGRPVTIRSGTSGAYPGSYTALFVGTNESVECDWEQIVLQLKDKQWKFSVPVLTTLYGGTNSLPNGLDGVAGDQKGKAIPLVYGKVYNIAPPLVNTSRLVYQLHKGLLNSIEFTYDSGVVLTVGTLRSLALMNLGSQPFTFTVDAATNIATTAVNTYTTADPVTVTTTTTLPAPLAINTIYYWRKITTTTGTFHPTALDATNNTNIVDITTTGTGTHTIDNNTTLAGRFDWAFDASGSYIRLGSLPAGQVTVDCTQGAAAANRTVAQLLKQFATDAGLSGGEISSADVTALDSANSSVVGIYLADSTTTYLTVMDQIANSVGAYYGFDSTGVLRMAQLTAPTGSPIVTLYDYDLIEPNGGIALTRVTPRDGGVPVWNVVVNHTLNYTVQSNGLAGSVGAVARAYLSNQTRSVNSSDASIKTQWQLSNLISVDTLLTASADAATEAARLLAMYKVRRDIYDATISVDIFTANSLKLLDLVTVQVSRFGMGSGKLFRIIGYSIQLSNNTVILTLWG